MGKLEEEIMQEIDTRIEIMNDEEYVFPKRLSRMDWIGVAVVSVVCLSVIIFWGIRLAGL